MSSVAEIPLSDAAARSGALGAAAVVSIVTTRPVDAAETLPATSVCFAVSVCAPAASAELVMLHAPAPLATAVPSTVVPLVSNSVTVAPASAPVPVNVGVVLLVMSSVAEIPLSDAAARSGALGAAAAVVSITIALFAPSEPAAPGAAIVRIALLPAASLIVPPFSASAAVLK